MREIKFRAWNKQKQIMCYDNEDETDDYWDGICTSKLEMVNTILSIPDKDDAYSINSFRNHYEVMQFTNLIDKNGTEIYEGDIVTSASPELIFQVVYKAPSFCRKWIDDVSKRYHDPIEPMAWNTHIICEVIGNIYEHPHLLSGDND